MEHSGGLIGWLTARPGLLVALAVGVTLAYAVLATAWNGHDPGWYAGLRRPWFQPPDVVFGVMWPLNFLVLFAGSATLPLRSPGLGARLLPVYVLSVVAALAWAYFFYVPHALTVAAYGLASAAALTWVLVLLIAGAGRVGWLPVGGEGGVPGFFALALVPYATWLTVATALSFGYARLN